MKNSIVQKIGFSLIFLCILLTLFFLGTIIYFIFAKGMQAISWSFLTQAPRNAMTEGGIAPIIIGTFYLTLGAMIFAVGSARIETGPLLKLIYGTTNLVESTLLVVEIFLTMVNT